NLAKANNIPWIIHVDETGRFKEEVADFAGIKVKPKPEAKDEHQQADIEVIKWLAHQTPTPLFAKEKIVHSYPHCMRCDTPIIYYALPSWFINIQKVKADILKSAESMTWVPAHLKEGRFKHITENAPDWNISRNRYWATPLPIWKCETCEKMHFVSSVEDLKNKSKKSGNKYFVMRHGGTEGNRDDKVSYKDQAEDNLTEEGKNEVMKTAESIKEQKIDLIVTSHFTRAKETSEILRNAFGLSIDAVVEEPRLCEMNPGKFDGGKWTEYHNHIKVTGPDWFDRRTEDGESLADVKKRTGEVLYELEEKYKGKNILIVTHGAPAWLLFVNTGMFEPDHKEYVPANSHVFVKEFKRFVNAEARELPFVPVPHDKNYEVDLHRPYIDSIKLACECGSDMARIPEVMDCWFESGSMPFAQDHFPFENEDWKNNNFPAGFVAEYIAQTRTWFYYSHVVSTILFGHAPYKNVVTTGTVRAEDGQKMSKSKNNFPDPNLLFNKYGVD
ncbi:MAG: class I tRNA ligase family protein, partial [Candidatus Nomurabacteria bacterium]|nr:class I tRNA ligase family protein [Candidatus Nomurabacteria bacterium]